MPISSLAQTPNRNSLPRHVTVNDLPIAPTTLHPTLAGPPPLPKSSLAQTPNRNSLPRQVTVNDLPIGRSVDETLRLLQAIQFHAEHGEVTSRGVRGAGFPRRTGGFVRRPVAGSGRAFLCEGVQSWGR